MTDAKVHVDLPGRAYDIHIGPDLLQDAGEFIAPLGGRKHICIVTDHNVAGLHLAQLQAGLAKAGLTSDAHVLPAGEATKCWAQLENTVEWLLAQKVERNDEFAGTGR